MYINILRCLFLFSSFIFWTNKLFIYHINVEWVKVTQLYLTLWRHGLYSPWNFPGQNTGVGNLFLLQGIFPTQGLNPGILHCRRILYQLNHKGSPRILEWVAYPFSSGSSQPFPVPEPGTLALQADSLPTELYGKPVLTLSSYVKI